jgi:hypothetical protein
MVLGMGGMRRYKNVVCFEFIVRGGWRRVGERQKRENCIAELAKLLSDSLFSVTEKENGNADLISNNCFFF